MCIVDVYCTQRWIFGDLYNKISFMRTTRARLYWKTESISAYVPYFSLLLVFVLVRILLHAKIIYNTKKKLCTLWIYAAAKVFFLLRNNLIFPCILNKRIFDFLWKQNANQISCIFIALLSAISRIWMVLYFYTVHGNSLTQTTLRCFKYE